jgi:hypothetical protein
MDKVDHDVALVKLRFDCRGKDIRQAMEQMVDLQLNIIYQIIGRSDWYLAKTMLEVPREEFAAAIRNAEGQR